jgi:hypothetical protein
MTTQEAVQRGALSLLREELRGIEALLGDGRAMNSQSDWDAELARLMGRLRFRQATVKRQIMLAASPPQRAECGPPGPRPEHRPRPRLGRGQRLGQRRLISQSAVVRMDIRAIGSSRSHG